MTHRPLTSLAISSPPLSIFRVHSTRPVVNTHRVASLSLKTVQASLHATHPIQSTISVPAHAF